MDRFTGRPAEEQGRLDKEIRSYDLLDRLGISYDRVDHEPAMTMEACLEAEAALEAKICKNLFLCNRQKTVFYLLLMPGDKHFRTKELSGQLGVARLSFGEEFFLQELLELTPGSVTVLGLMNDPGQKVQLVIDADVLKEDWFACHPCINTSSLRMSAADFREKLLPGLGHTPIYVELPGA